MFKFIILQPFCRYTYITAHSPTLPSLHLHHSSFSNLSITSPTSQLILQTFRHFTYVTTHSPTLPSLYLRHSSFSDPSVASPTSQFILQPLFRFSYVTSSSLNSPGESPMLDTPENVWQFGVTKIFNKNIYWIVLKINTKIILGAAVQNPLNSIGRSLIHISTFLIIKDSH